MTTVLKRKEIDFVIVDHSKDICRSKLPRYSVVVIKEEDESGLEDPCSRYSKRDGLKASSRVDDWASSPSTKAMHLHIPSRCARRSEGRAMGVQGQS